MNKRYIILFVLVFVLMSAAMASGQNCYNNCCYPCYQQYSVPQPVVRECASFVSDVTIADGSYVAPGSTFIKTWRIRNNGTTTWTTNYKLVFVSGTQMAAQNYVNLPYNVGPGQSVDISVQMTAPTEAGSYKSEWKLVNESGTQFGVGTNCQTPVWAQIVNYVQTYNYNYNYGYCGGWCSPCYSYGWCGGVPGFNLDKDMNPKPGTSTNCYPPAPWYW